MLHALVDGQLTDYPTKVAGSQDGSDFIDSSTGPIVKLTDPEIGHVIYRRGTYLQARRDGLIIDVPLADLAKWEGANSVEFKIAGMVFPVGPKERPGLSDFLAKTRLFSDAK